jgi:hypothetical protein
MRVDPVCAAHDRARGPLRDYLAAAVSYAKTGRPTLPEVQALGALAQCARDEVIGAALSVPDEGSGERYLMR